MSENLAQTWAESILNKVNQAMANPEEERTPEEVLLGILINEYHLLLTQQLLRSAGPINRVANDQLVKVEEDLL